MTARRASLLSLALGLILGLGVAFLLPSLHRGLLPEGAVSRVMDPPAVVRQIRGLSQLVTVKYTIQKALAIEEKKVPLGTERLLLFVQAEVAAGLDLSSLQAEDVRAQRDGVLLVSLPRAEVTSVVLDDTLTKVWDRSITWWTPWVPFNQDLERQARLQARDEVEKAARDMGILTQARQNAEAVIRGLLMSAGAKEVKFLDRS